MFPQENPYQRRVWELQQEIFQCPFLNSNKSPNCINELDPSVLDPEQELGPDSIFVGQYYGEIDGVPKILFVGKNPNSKPGDFGPKGNLNLAGIGSIAEILPEEYYARYFEGVSHDSDSPQLYGIKQWDLYTDPFWGIERILTYLYPDNLKIREGFAYSNAVLCKGCADAGNPGEIMWNNCIRKARWLRQTIEALEPDIIFIFSIAKDDSTWDHFNEENKVVDHEDFLHPQRGYAYHVRIKLPNKIILNPLVIGIPHLTQPKFQTWCSGIPSILREIFSDLTPEYFVNHILDAIADVIKKELG